MSPWWKINQHRETCLLISSFLPPITEVSCQQQWQMCSRKISKINWKIIWKTKTERTLQIVGVCHCLYVKCVCPWATARKKGLEIDLHRHYLLMWLHFHLSSLRYTTARASDTVVNPRVQLCRWLGGIHFQGLGFPLPGSYQKKWKQTDTPIPLRW